MDPNCLKYKIINECKCGFEELFNLIGLVDFTKKKEIDTFVKEIVSLHEDGFIECRFASKKVKTITENQLNEHIVLRVSRGEEIESYPENGKEYSFYSTEKAIKQLQRKDQPLIKDSHDTTNR